MNHDSISHIHIVHYVMLIELFQEHLAAERIPIYLKGTKHFMVKVTGKDTADIVLDRLLDEMKIKSIKPDVELIEEAMCKGKTITSICLG